MIDSQHVKKKGKTLNFNEKWKKKLDTIVKDLSKVLFVHFILSFCWNVLPWIVSVIYEIKVCIILISEAQLFP